MKLTPATPSHRSRIEPSQSLLAGRKYVPAAETNLRRTFALVRAALKKEAA